MQHGAFTFLATPKNVKKMENAKAQNKPITLKENAQSKR